METLHICNTFFEWELTQKGNLSLINCFKAHPRFHEFQYLPLRYAKEGLVGVTELREPSTRLRSFSDKHLAPMQINSYGPSAAIAAWAEKGGHHYITPPINLVRKLASKESSFHLGLPPKGSRLLHSEEELKEWLMLLEGPKVLKNCFGWAGRGHRLVNKECTHLSFAQKEWQEGRPLIGEPWVERYLDFSTHWEISDAIHYHGATKIENTRFGGYKATIVNHSFGKELKEHIDFVTPLLASFQEEGFFGPISFDAMLYAQEGKTHLQPLVEINPRMTMSSIILKST